MSEFSSEEFEEQERARTMTLRLIAACLADAGIPVQHRERLAMNIWNAIAEFPSDVRTALG